MDYTKLPLGRSLNELATKRAAQAIQNTGRSLPASVAAVVQSGIVTVRFEVNSAQFTLPQVTVPVLGSEYFRMPLQVGAKGFVIAADARLHQMSGLGTGQPDLTQPGNLTALVFAPFGSTSWPPLPAGDETFSIIYGEDGVLIQLKPTTPPAIPSRYIFLGPDRIQLLDGVSSVLIDHATGNVTVTNGSASISMVGTTLNLTGDVKITGGLDVSGTSNLGGPGATAIRLASGGAATKANAV